MTPTQFRAWRERHFRSHLAAGRALGIQNKTVARYERGETPVPRPVAMACALVDMLNPAVWPGYVEE